MKSPQPFVNLIQAFGFHARNTGRNGLGASVRSSQRGSEVGGRNKDVAIETKEDVLSFLKSQGMSINKELFSEESAQDEGKKRLSDREINSLERKQDRIRDNHYRDYRNEDDQNQKRPPSLANLARDDYSRRDRDEFGRGSRDDSRSEARDNYSRGGRDESSRGGRDSYSRGARNDNDTHHARDNQSRDRYP